METTASFRVGGGRNRRRTRGYATAQDPQQVATPEQDARREDGARRWAPKWRRLVEHDGTPRDFAEFDRVVRGMLNRISTDNARYLLPLEPSLRGAASPCGDCPSWWAARFSALMLNSYLNVIQTNRFSRGLAMRSVDNVLPEYLDAIAPLLERSPNLIEALTAWFARLFRWHDMCWSTTRLVLLAARESRDRTALLPHALANLPPELIERRILGYLAPPPLSVASGRLENSPLGEYLTCGPEEQKDIVAVLIHLLVFAPAAAWPLFSAFAFPLAEACLTGDGEYDEWRVFIAASIVVAIAQRLERNFFGVQERKSSQLLGEQPALLVDLSLLRRLATLLQDTTGTVSTDGAEHSCEGRSSCQLSRFVASRCYVAVEQVDRLNGQLRASRLIQSHNDVLPMGLALPTRSAITCR